MRSRSQGRRTSPTVGRSLSVLSMDLSLESKREDSTVVRPSLLLPQIHATHPVKLDLCPDSVGARETDGQTGSDCCCPRNFAKWILSTPDLWTGERRRDMSTVPRGFHCRRGSCFWLSLLSRRGVGALIHIRTGDISYWGPKCPVEKRLNV